MSCRSDGGLPFCDTDTRPSLDGSAHLRMLQQPKAAAPLGGDLPDHASFLSLTMCNEDEILQDTAGWIMKYAVDTRYVICYLCETCVMNGDQQIDRAISGLNRIKKHV